MIQNHYFPFLFYFIDFSRTSSIHLTRFWSNKLYFLSRFKCLPLIINLTLYNNNKPPDWRDHCHTNDEMFLNLTIMRRSWWSLRYICVDSGYCNAVCDLYAFMSTQHWRSTPVLCPSAVCRRCGPWMIHAEGRCAAASCDLFYMVSLPDHACVVKRVCPVTCVIA